MNLPFTDQQDLRDIWTVEALPSGTPDAQAALGRLEGKYGAADVNQAKNAYEDRGAYGNPTLHSFAAYSDVTLVAFMNKTKFEKFAASRGGTAALKFSSWADALTLLGRANLIPQLK